MQYLSHDPNYCIGDEDEEMDTQDADWEDDEDNQYSDTDDDLSWKVRRACAKALATEVVILISALRHSFRSNIWIIPEQNY